MQQTQQHSPGHLSTPKKSNRQCKISKHKPSHVHSVSLAVVILSSNIDSAKLLNMSSITLKDYLLVYCYTGNGKSHNYAYSGEHEDKWQTSGSTYRWRRRGKPPSSCLEMTPSSHTKGVKSPCLYTLSTVAPCTWRGTCNVGPLRLLLSWSCLEGGGRGKGGKGKLRSCTYIGLKEGRVKSKGISSYGANPINWVICGIRKKKESLSDEVEGV